MYSKPTIFYLDLETTVYDGQEETEAWSVEIGGGDLQTPINFSNLASAWNWLIHQYGSLLIYIHNLKFDGTYFIDFFERNKILKQGRIKQDEKEILKDRKQLKNGEYIYNISNKGIWYNIIIKHKNRYIELRDSLKLIPFKLEKIGKDFDTKHKKLEMDYGNKPPGYIPTADELEYIKNDIYVLQEAVEMMLKDGHDKMTIGSCCMCEFKKIFGREDYEQWFPDVYEIPIDRGYFGDHINYSASMGEYVLRSYRGAFCDVNPKYKGKLQKRGFTLDVTSLYSSVMHSKSGNFYPIGKGKMWKGDIPPEALRENRYYFVRFRCAFRIKENYLPFVQIKNDWRYKSTEHLATSAVFNKKDGLYYDYVDGEVGRHKVVITMCQDEFELFLKHYNVYELEILDGIIFYADIGMFDQYIDKYFDIKSNSKGAKRSLAKLYLNNLYGKFATSPDSSYKLIGLENNVLRYHTVIAKDKQPGYIPVGSAVTAKARRFTISAAQQNFNIFCYADTDSLHCLGDPLDAKGVVIADNELCTWKLEDTWIEAYFTRQKTYIERLSNGTLNIKCAGMPDRCKDLFAGAVDQDYSRIKNLTDDEIRFLQYKKEITDFNVGLKIPSKLYSKLIPGGTLLYTDFYTMR